MAKEKKTWGGSRKNAGRSPTGDRALVRLTAMVDPEIVKQLPENKSAFIREAIEEKLKREA